MTLPGADACSLMCFSLVFDEILSRFRRTRPPTLAHARAASSCRLFPFKRMKTASVVLRIRIAVVIKKQTFIIFLNRRANSLGQSGFPPSLCAA